jgi:putative DNA primase/helicase
MSKSNTSNDTLTTAAIADMITSTDHFAQDVGGLLYVYRGGVYRPCGEAHIRQQVKHLLCEQGREDEWESKLAGEVSEYIRADAIELWEVPPPDLVNVQNGLLNVHNRELRPHSPEHLSSIQLPVTYDSAAVCLGWDLFVEETFPDDSREVAYEIPAWAMLPDTSIQKAVLLTGEGSNGKSAYLAGLCAFLGRRNVAGVNLHKLESDRFAAARLMGKLANVCPDIPSTRLFGTSAFKALTGGDLLHGERKYRESFEFRSFAKLVFSANQPPFSDDSSYAFSRRWLVVPFTRTFEENAQDRQKRSELDALLADPYELSGLLNRALDALPRLHSKGFTTSDTLAGALKEFKEATDPLTVWLNEHVDDEATAFIPKRELMVAYNSACTAAKRAPMNGTAFGLALRRARPSLRDGQRTVAGKKTDVYLGIEWKRGCCVA